MLHVLKKLREHLLTGVSYAIPAHMQMFSRFARKLMDEEFRARLIAAQDADSVIELLSAELAVAK